MKKIALFGGSGQTGKEFLQLALAQGHTVRALARTPQKIKQQSPELEVVQGDVLHYDDVTKTVAGSEVVVSLFGHVKGSPDWLQTQGTEHIVRAMKEHGVDRIISLSGGGLPYEKDQPKIADKVIRLIMKIAVPKVLKDAERHAEVLKASGLKWTIVRGPRLTNEPRQGKYRVGWVGINASTKIGRADLADFILEEVTQEAFNHQMPFVSY